MDKNTTPKPTDNELALIVLKALNAAINKLKQSTTKK
jgi:hypothetical protein